MMEGRDYGVLHEAGDNGINRMSGSKIVKRWKGPESEDEV